MKKFIICTFLALALFFTGTFANPIENQSNALTRSQRKKIVRVAKAAKYRRCPYRYGGNSLYRGVDCSGFVNQVYRRIGKRLPRTSYAMRRVGRRVPYNKKRVGDIICYRGHVAIYLGRGRIIHASTPRTGVCYGRVNYTRVVCVRRIGK